MVDVSRFLQPDMALTRLEETYPTNLGVCDPDGGKPKLRGDVAPEVAGVAGWFAPNPGGVGPMTRAMLLTNVVEAAERALAESA